MFTYALHSARSSSSVHMRLLGMELSSLTLMAGSSFCVSAAAVARFAAETDFNDALDLFPFAVGKGGVRLLAPLFFASERVRELSAFSCERVPGIGAAIVC